MADSQNVNTISLKFVRAIITGRTSRSSKPSGFRGRKSEFSPEGASHVKFGMAAGHMSPLDSANFNLNRCKGVGTRP